MDFQDGRHGGHLGFLNGTILAIFICNPLDASYQASSQLAFRFRRRSENRFSRWPPRWPPWISDLNDFTYFRSASHPDALYQVLNQFGKKQKNSFPRCPQ